MMGYRIRNASIEDAATIAHQRVAMFTDMGLVPDSLGAQLLEASAASLSAALRDATYLGWLVIHEEQKIVGGAGVHLKPQLPRVSEDGTSINVAHSPLIVNVYTEPDHRRRGLARELMAVVMTWAKGQGFDRVELHASDAGRPLYRSLGFAPTNEMRWSPPRS